MKPLPAAPHGKVKAASLEALHGRISPSASSDLLRTALAGPSLCREGDSDGPAAGCHRLRQRRGSRSLCGGRPASRPWRQPAGSAGHARVVRQRELAVSHYGSFSGTFAESARGGSYHPSGLCERRPRSAPGSDERPLRGLVIRQRAAEARRAANVLTHRGQSATRSRAARLCVRGRQARRVPAGLGRACTRAGRRGRVVVRRAHDARGRPPARPRRCGGSQVRC